MPPASPVAFDRQVPRLTFQVITEGQTLTFTLEGAELKRQASALIGQAKDTFKHGISFTTEEIGRAHV